MESSKPIVLQPIADTIRMTSIFSIGDWLPERRAKPSRMLVSPLLHREAILPRKKEALRAFCLEHHIKVDRWIQDIGSALNYKRKGFNQIIEEIELGHVKRLVIGYEDRFVRFGYDWFEAFCERHGTAILVVNGEALSPNEELVRDLLAIITVFSARLHGLRSHRNSIRAAALGKEITDDQSAQGPAPSHF